MPSGKHEKFVPAENLSGNCLREMEGGTGQAKPKADQPAKKPGRPKTADLYFLVFIHLGTRWIWVSPCTAHPTADWTSQQARNFAMNGDEHDLPCRTVMRDNDQKYPKTFDDVFTTSTCRIKQTYRPQRICRRRSSG
jgi:hypothetical protein